MNQNWHAGVVRVIGGYFPSLLGEKMAAIEKHYCLGGEGAPVRVVVEGMHCADHAVSAPASRRGAPAVARILSSFITVLLSCLHVHRGCERLG